MNDSEMLAALRQLPFFDGFTDEMLLPSLPISRLVEFPAGTVIFRQGDPARDIYFVLEGTVALELCGSAVGCRRLMTVGKRELLGWSPILEQEHLTATARTTSPVQAIEINGPELVNFCRANPQIGFELMKRTAIALAKRLNATRLQLVNVYGDDDKSTHNRPPCHE